MNRQKLITILATITIISILSVSLFFTQFSAATATTYDADKMTVNGVLASDSYVLFPFDKANLIFGFSKYGELINGEVGQANGQGLEYKGMDVFANPNVLERDWSQGWLIDIHYVDGNNNYKRAWAFALYSDLTGTTGIGGDWKEECTAKDGSDGNYGGRKTNVWAKTDPIKVLYDGPRRFVALTKTILYGTSTKTSDDELVSITITFVFNKDKKQVTLFKDIKKLDKGKFGSTFQVEFSNRGEWDIGTDPAPPSYAHFYDNLTTVYGNDYHDFYTDSGYNLTGYDLCQMIDEGGSYVGWAAYWPQLYGKDVEGTTGAGDKITFTEIRSSLCTKEYNNTWLELGSPANKQIIFGNYTWPNATSYPTGLGDSTDDPMVFKNGVHLPSEHYIWTSPDNITLTTTEPANTDYITIVYKHELNNETKDMDVTEPNTPYVIGEWCFDLENVDGKRQFRAVTMYGLTDRHDAEDVQASAETWSTAANTIDTEVQYLLNETFNPYDLYSAVHKQESRWLYYDDSLSAATSYITLADGLDDQLYYNTSAAEWSGYGIENATWLADGLPKGFGANSAWVNEFEDEIDAHSKNWALNLTGEGGDVNMLKITPIADTPTSTAPLTLQLKDLVDFGFWYKSYGTSETIGPYININVTSTANPATAPKQACIEARSDNYISAKNGYLGWNHYTLNTIETFIGPYSSDSAFHLTSETNTDDALIADGFRSFEYWTSKLADYYVEYVGVVIYKNCHAYVDDVSIGYLSRTSGIRYERVYNMEEDKLIPSDWDEYCVFPERVLVDDVLIARKDYQNIDPTKTTGHRSYYDINFETGNLTFSHWVSGTGYTTWTLPIGTHIKVLYSTIEENEKGRYEWMVVGKNAAAIDSIGAAYMTQAFDSRKDIEVLLTGLDINDTVNGPHAPFVMGGAVTGTRTNYYFDYPSDNRSGLRDDWCTTYPVASSNMLFAGGPRAQLGTEYFNEFTMAFFAMSEYVVNDTGQANKIMGLSCWNRTTYGAGYAVVSVYKDLNGTIGFLIWGYNGEDTYYATKWFWDTGIVYLQTENRGVTDIILKITYTTCPYTVSIVEHLGTISEKPQHDC